MIDTDSTEYQVALPVFEGPLDLLLHLIERQELDIAEVSLAQVTNQYLDYLARISERDPDNLADFLVIAAKLLLIKSRVLLPQPPASLQSEEEEGDDLVRQLVEYKRFKEAARWLQQLDEEGQRSYLRLAGVPALERSIDLGDVSLQDLLDAVRQALAIKPPRPSVNGTVPPITITIAQQMAFLESELARGRPVRFRHLLEGARHRLEVIVTLLAVLEMIKQLRVVVRQDRLFGDIVIEKKKPSSSPSRQA